MANNNSLHQNKDILIREAAIELFYRQSIPNTTMAEIAKEAGIAKGTLYLYYKNKKGLINHVFDYCFNLHMEASMEDLNLVSSNREKLKKRVKNILFWNYRNPKESTVARMYYRPINVVGVDNVAFTKSYMINKNFIEKGLKNGEFKKLPLEFLCKIFFSCVEGTSSYVRNNPNILKDEKLLEKILETMVDSISC